MYTLLLDSSNIKLSVGLVSDGKIVDSISYDAWQKQSEYMVNEIHSILEKNKITAFDINTIVVTKGPGSYTGVRIALCIAKIMAYAIKSELYLVSSLEVLKNGSTKSLCLMNARSNRSFVAAYENGTCILEEQIMSNDKVLELINTKEYVACGDLTYLNLQGYQSNIFIEMLDIVSRNKPVENVLSVKPVYLKD